MHPVANAVEVPTDKILEAFEKAAVPDFTGQVSVHIRLLPTAAHEVEFRVETKRSLPVNFGTNHEEEKPFVTNDRINAVRMKLRELKLILYTPVVCVSGNFAKGMLKSFVVQEISA